MHVTLTLLVGLSLAFWDGQGDEGNLKCAKCELKSAKREQTCLLMVAALMSDKGTIRPRSPSSPNTIDLHRG